MVTLSRSTAAVAVLLAAFNASLASYDLPDTGLVKCYSDLEEITCPDQRQPFYGQDAHYQGDISRYIDNQDGTVTDQFTGLRWDQSDGEALNWEDAGAHCSSRGARLPRLDELETIVDYTRSGPAIDPIFSTQTTEYWTSSGLSSQFGPGFAWFIHFHIGQSGTYDKDQVRYVRCVRDDWDRLWVGEEYRDNGDGTVWDTINGLYWQNTQTSPRSWQQALEYCDGLELAGKSWRLPNIRELRSLADEYAADPAISTIYFQAESAPYWSATTSAAANNIAWSVNFATGIAWTTNGAKSYFHHVRCVAQAEREKLKLEISGVESPPWRVVSQPQGIDCGKKCSADFFEGARVHLTVSHDLVTEFNCAVTENDDKHDFDLPNKTFKVWMTFGDKKRKVSCSPYFYENEAILQNILNLLLLEAGPD